MNKDVQNNFKDIYPPTPAAFSKRIDSTVSALPERGARWRLPAPAIAGYAAAACAAVALLLLGAILPKAPGMPTQTEQTPAPSSVLADGGVMILPITSLPPVEPLPRLAVTESSAVPAAADGWQAVAYCGDVSWYYQASEGELAYTSNGKTVSIALKMDAMQTIGAYSFLAGQEGRWLAFTVHEPGADKVWVVTGDGGKLVVPDDIRQVNYYNESVLADFSGCKMVPYSNEILAPIGTDMSSNTVYDGLMICVSMDDGSAYMLQISLSALPAGKAYTVNDRRGLLTYAHSFDSEQQAFIPTQEFIYRMDKEEDGRYRVDFLNHAFRAALDSNRFSIFKSNDREGYSIRPSCALFIYQDDPQKTLWELNMYTGEITELAQGCMAAGWVDGSSMWYVLSGDAATIRTRKSSIMNGVVQATYMIPGTSGSNIMNMQIMAVIKNGTDADVTISEQLPCNLAFTYNNETLWAADGQFKLEDAVEAMICTSEGTGETAKPGPITIQAGGFLSLEIASIPLEREGEYKLEGSIYKSKTISYVMKLPFVRDHYPPGLTVKGGITADRRLSVTVNNQSRATYTITQPVVSAGAKTILYPCAVQYRLYRGDEKVDEGLLQMSDNVLLGSERNLDSGESLTLVEVGDTPRFSGLQTGEYRLECLFSATKNPKTEYWGYYGTDFYQVDFTVPDWIETQ